MRRRPWRRDSLRSFVLSALPESHLLLHQVLFCLFSPVIHDPDDFAKRFPHGPDASSPPVHTFFDEFVRDLVSAMFVEAISWWLEQGRPPPPKRWPLALPCLPLCFSRKRAPGNDRLRART